MSIELTNDAKKAIRLFHKAYKKRLKEGSSFAKATCLGGSNRIQQELLPNWSRDRIETVCKELGKTGLLYCMWANNVLYNSSITDAGISYAQNYQKKSLIKIKDSLLNIVDHIVGIFIK